MKKYWRRLLSFALLFVMIVTGVPLQNNAVNAKAETASITVHYKGTDTTPNIYYWNLNNGTNNPVSWPGTKMTPEGNNWYTYTFSYTSSVNLIFNQNGSQTADLSRTTGEWWYKDSKWYSYNPDAPVDIDDSITVHFKSPWNGARIYYWGSDPAGTTTSWPGVNMKAGTDGWYSYTWNNTRSINLIFNYNGNQTADLSRTTGEWWYKDSKWYNANPEKPVPTATPKPTAKPSPVPTATPVVTQAPTEPPITEDMIKVHFKSPWNGAKIYIWATKPASATAGWPGTDMVPEQNGWYSYTLANTTSTNLIFNYNGSQTADLNRTAGEWWYKDNRWYDYNPDKVVPTATPVPTVTPVPTPRPTAAPGSGIDFRDETIYFVMVTRFYDGDSSNNVHCWDEVAAAQNSNDPAWRGDFAGLIEKLDYIKALGFSSIWITPVVKNMSGYDYHGYHAVNFSEVDPRYESAGATYQDLIDAAHAKGLKIIQDIVLNHTGNFGEENLYPMFTKDETQADTADAIIRIDESKLPDNYEELTPGEQYQARIAAMKEDYLDTDNIYHHEKSLSWESYTVQTGQIAGDCVDLNTENPTVANYLVQAYNRYIDMGVDAFRIDTVKHVSRLTFNNEFIPAFKAAGGEDFYMFGEVATRYRQVWNNNIPAISTPFYTWAESKTYPWGDTRTNMQSVYQNWLDNQSVDAQPTSDNHLLSGNNYHTPDESVCSGLNVIDFPMHWNFNNASDAFRVGVDGDKYYSDATWNVTYVDSHDYAPDCAPENQRFAGTQDTWAENLNLMYTFRGIPCIFYGSEVEFMKGAVIDPGPTKPLSETGRAYFGDHIEGSVNVTDYAEYTNATGTMAESLNHPLSLHIQRLNKIRREIPALRKGQYSTEGVWGNMAFKRRYTNEAEGVDSFVLVSITNGATFNGIPNGTYKDAITGDVKVVTNQTLNIPSTGKGNMRIYVLDLSGNPAPGKIGTDGKYLK